MPATSINIVTPLQGGVGHLVELLNEYLGHLSLNKHQYKMSVDEMGQSDTKVFVARNENGDAIGTTALKIHTSETC